LYGATGYGQIKPAFSSNHLIDLRPNMNNDQKRIKDAAASAAQNRRQL
jgi:hypothetical protein